MARRSVESQIPSMQRISLLSKSVLYIVIQRAPSPEEKKILDPPQKETFNNRHRSIGRGIDDNCCPLLCKSYITACTCSPQSSQYTYPFWYCNRYTGTESQVNMVISSIWAILGFIQQVTTLILHQQTIK